MAIEHVAAHITREIPAGVAAYEALPFRMTTLDGAELTLTETDTVSVVVYSPLGSVIPAGLAATIEAGTPLIHLVFDTSSGAYFPKGERYRAMLTVTRTGPGGGAHSREIPFDVVRQPFIPQVSDDHFPPHLRATAGEAGFRRVVQTAYGEFVTWLRATVRLDRLTGDAWTAYYGLGSARRLNATGAAVAARHRPALVFSQDEANECLRHWALKLAYREAMARAGDIWSRQYDEAAADLDEAKKRLLLTMTYDEDDDGHAPPPSSRLPLSSAWAER